VAEFGDVIEAADDTRIRDFGVLLSAAARLERLLGRAIEREYGITHVMFEVLLRLAAAAEHRLPIRDIATNLTLTSGGMTRLVDRMVVAGLVKRVPSTGDRRMALVMMTDQGAAVLRGAAGRHADNLDRDFVGALTAEEYRDMMISLRRLNEVARVRLGRLG